MSRRTHVLITLASVVIWTWMGLARLNDYLAARRTEEPFHVEFIDLMAPVLVAITILQLAKFLCAPKPERMNDPYAEVIIADWAILRLFRVLICLVFMVSGALALAGPSDALATPIWSACWMGLGIYGLVNLLFTPKFRFAMGRDGIEYSNVRPARIAWEDILDVKLKTVLTTPTIVLTLREAKQFRSSFLFARWRQLSQLKLHPLHFGVDAGELSRGIENRRHVFTF